MNLAHRITLLIVLLTAPMARASDLSTFHTAVADAYGFYRSAMFYLRTGNAMVAGFELDQMRSRWSALTERYSSAPPDAYSDLPDFAERLRAIEERLAEAAKAATDGDAQGASQTLRPIRGELARTRAEAGVRVFSDCIDELNEAVAALFVYRREKPLDAESADHINDVKSKAAVVSYVLSRCDAQAPEAVRNDEEFRRLIDGMLPSTAGAFDAADAKDARGVVNYLRELYSFDRILYLRFG